MSVWDMRCISEKGSNTFLTIQHAYLSESIPYSTEERKINITLLNTCRTVTQFRVGAYTQSYKP